MNIKSILLLTAIFGSFLLSQPARAQENNTSAIMKNIGKGFKTIFKATLRSDNSEANQLLVLKLKENIGLVKEILPTNVSPDDAILVEKYRSIMTELFEQAILLQDSFATDPLNKEATLEILKAMDAIRKRGHGIFR